MTMALMQCMVCRRGIYVEMATLIVADLDANESKETQAPLQVVQKCGQKMENQQQAKDGKNSGSWRNRTRDRRLGNLIPITVPQRGIGDSSSLGLFI